MNFPKLQLAGVILADTGLHMPDFRAGERTFALITQVAGRAGRGEFDGRVIFQTYLKNGKVIVQTYDPAREPIFFACNFKNTEFYDYELTQRQFLEFPPFSRLVRLVFRSFNKNLAFETAMEAIGEVTGATVRDDITARIFERFCVGK